MQAGDALQELLQGRFAEASERIQEVSDPALRSMLEEFAAGRIPPTALLGSIGGYQEAIQVLLRPALTEPASGAGLAACD